MKNEELKHIGYRMIGSERWEVLVGGDSFTYKADRKGRRIIVADRPDAVRNTIVEAAVRELQAEFVERTYPSNPPPAASKCRYPADSLGILVKLVDGPLKTKDGQRFTCQIKSDSLIVVDRRASLDERRRSATLARQVVLERLSKEEMQPFEADAKAAMLKIDPPRPIHRAADGRFLCPHCDKPYKTWAPLRSHISYEHDDKTTRHFMYYNGPETAIPFAAETAGVRP